MRITRSFEGQKIPTFPITLRGPLSNTFGEHEYEAGIDTGFTGFMFLPFLEALKPGLILRGAMPLTLADGKPQTFLYCLGEVLIESKSDLGIVLISPSDDVLIGMEFLTQFGLKLIVDPISKSATLTDEEILLQAAQLPEVSS
ncbi:MAG: hypothetical protein AB1644_13895 [Candidatus Zixiibacteriota bacterium]